MEHTIVEYLAENNGYRCGYCGASDSNFSHGMWAHAMTCQDYLDLIDRGWRRSGKYVYKPTMDKMCCPLYTIRCHAPTFKISKSQKKVLKKAAKYFATGEKSGGGQEKEQGDGLPSDAPKQSEDTSTPSHQEPPAPSRLPQMSGEELGCVEAGKVKVAVGSGITEINESRVPRPDGDASMAGEAGLPENQQEKTSTGCKKKPAKPGLGADPTKPQCKKAKLRRLEKKQQKLAKGLEQTDHQSKAVEGPKTLEELIMDMPSNQPSKHKLETNLVRSSPMSDEFRRTFEESYAVYKKYQMTIHNDPETKCTVKQYKRFLVDSPLLEYHSEETPECGYGSFHQHYVLDGKIIAVGVVDILPTCLSSVYFYYDPDYRFLSLGTFSALREIAFTRLLQVTAPSIEYYYMGFYVHSCRKMRYKGQYYPSYLLCPEGYTWHPMEECRPLLDANKYSRFSPPTTVDVPYSLRDILVLHKHVAMTYNVYKQYRPNAKDSDEVEEYARLAGKKCVEKMLLYRH
ncbi:arginyl-tRNA--protein transferase 1-like [Diadema antillarum]|uniref:arginyl-tRNA--protein transferase 1-like n=1 Tax=Diadema antillarum TaxID=105358 RepID=UPI003A8C1A2C